MKNTLLLLTTCAFLTIKAQIPGNGLVAYFPFFGNAKDSSVNKTNGTISNAALTTDRFGNPNAAYQFSGNGNSYISFSSAYVVNNRYTYSLWAKINSIPSSGAMAFMLNIGSFGGDQSLNIANNYSGNNGWLGGGYNTVAPHFGMQQGANLSTAAWAHIVSVRDSNHVRLYVNGVLVDSLGSSTVKYPYYGSGPVKAYIGARNDKTGPFNGKIDDICIYNRALSKSEVMQLYNDQSTSVENIRKQKFAIDLFPNPSAANFNVHIADYPGSYEQLQVKVINAIGQEIGLPSELIEHNLIQIDHQLPAGIYLLSITDIKGGIIATEKLIVY